MRQVEALQGVTSEWQTTAEVARGVPSDGRIPDRSYHNGVYISLRRLHKNGLVEKRQASRGGHKVAEWRLAP